MNAPMPRKFAPGAAIATRRPIAKTNFQCHWRFATKQRRTYRRFSLNLDAHHRPVVSSACSAPLSVAPATNKTTNAAQRATVFTNS
ncbi:hypothetical protein KCP74_09720 [Salmonella enterica subsp. enterica]|nr:hypothetical protein KCP74_09720 [Salmonella enterica subsp. enterica]